MSHPSSIPTPIQNQLAALAEKRKYLLGLPSEKALSAILEDNTSLALTRSFPEEDLYILIKEIGPEDALPILSLASNRQWQFCIDMESWDRDRIQPLQFARWMNLLLAADPDRFIQWIIKEQLEPLEYFLQQYLEIFIREHDQDPSDFPDDAVTLDGIYYFRFRQPAGKASSNDTIPSDIEQFLERFINHISEHNDHITFQNLLLESQWVIANEMEEEAYRLKSARLSEKGFMPYEQAVSLYQPLDTNLIRPRIVRRHSPDEEKLFAPPSTMILQNTENHPLDITMDTLRDDPIFQDILIEMTTLANQVAVADRMRIESREDLLSLIRKVRAYLGIGIELISGKSVSPHTASSILRQYPLSAVFQAGYGNAMKLHFKTKRWLRISWFRKYGLTLGFWTESGMGTLGGILLPRPKYYHPSMDGPAYREFSSLGEIIETENRIDLWMKMDKLLEKLHPSFSAKALNQIDREYLTYQSWLLSHYAAFKLNRSVEELPLDLKAFKTFFPTLWGGDLDENTRPKHLSPKFRQDFLDWLALSTQLSATDVLASIGSLIETLLHDLETELGSVSENHVDPRFIRLFWVEHS